MTTEPAASSDAPVGWGILATGKIAHAFARDLAQVPGARLAAVGSRRQASADAFAAEYGAAAAHGSYEALVADPAVEVVYIATPHAMHHEDATMAIEAGKHVLCEKPLTLNVAEAERMVALARERGVFLMEAMWMACHPVVRAVRAALADGRFGTARHVHAELGFKVEAGPDDRMFDPALGASALLDMGIYPLTVSHLLLGEAEHLHGTAALSERGIDLDVAITGRYPGGALATMTASMTSWSSSTAWIATDLGRIEMPEFHHPPYAEFTPFAGGWTSKDGQTGRGEPVRIAGEEPVIGQGYGNEALEVQRCLRAGLLESPLVPHDQTLTLMRQMDALRDQIGVHYSVD
ncbi:Gfo/Idh/MocA family oxidoreductase [Nocardioides ferulae]|uniref:Gfo/Idh/MocA family oxidoreductase n=1 Tax=Nocardioides ferulae TaxID=2340821 RepID=UPI000EACF8F8|nr:Gfo/Idh/MocA family oxidoreductase [Nocardioides ferulae]